MDAFLATCSETTADPSETDATADPTETNVTAVPIDEETEDPNEAATTDPTEAGTANPTGAMTAPLGDIPTIAVDAGSFSTLIAALEAANLVSELGGQNGPFTVFAPDDDAFSALPDGLISCLLEPENSDVLSSILTYHVVEGAIFSTDLVNGDAPVTLNGETISIDLSNGVSINGDSTVITPDIETSNGVIHIIDSGK